ncbi:ubiquitin thioesterase trabid [Oratosquilla oratoria]|uniref:ubiquitin thioesterase trabid n=1 Tax=Oratosquilla oratoria TaxID=337810 RepID=UPI003F777363
MSEGSNKWTCSRCTYLNFVNAMRCTMCSTLRAPHLIVEAGTDIYQIGSQAASSPVITSAPRSSPKEQSSPETEKWSCHMCTYLNFPRGIRCTQCFSPRSSLADHLTSLSITTTTQASSSEAQTPIITQTNNKTLHTNGMNRGRQSPQGSRISQGKESPQGDVGRQSPQGAHNALSQPTGAAVNRAHSQEDAREGGHGDNTFGNHKWMCKACTYENWPRAGRCVMCSTPKGTATTSTQSVTTSSATTTPSSIPARLATPPPPTDCKNNNMNSDKNISQSEGHKGNKKKIDLICDVHDAQKNDNNAKNKENNEINKAKMESSPQEPLIARRGSTCDQNENHNSSMNKSSGGSANNAPSGTNNPAAPPSVNHWIGEGAVGLNNYETERILRQLRRRLREADCSWLNACIGVVEGNYEPVEAYLSGGGDPMRQLTTTDVKLLARPSAFDEGHTLVHLAIRFGREDLLATILSRMDGGGAGVKRVPPYVAPDLATDIRRHISSSIRQRKGAFPCYYVSDLASFSLPAEVEELPGTVQEQLFDELLDRDAQKQLDEDTPIINWSLEITDRLGSRLYALWNRTAGDCLLDSVLQATWGVFDRENVLRRALADSLSEASHIFYPRWKEYERWQARLLDYYVPEGQVLEEWAELICLASQPGAALEQLHIFVLAHILRRPIIVYGVKCVKSFRGEDLGFARFEGVYLPLLWDASFCWKSPIALGYTRGHFSALVPMEPDASDNLGAGAILDPGESQIVFLPLMTHDHKLLPVHFLTQAEVGCEESLLRSWLEVCVSEGGILVAQQHLTKKPLTVAQMTEEWLNHYRRLAQMECAPYHRPIASQGYSSDGDSDEE